jgi:beta-lactamase class A
MRRIGGIRRCAVAGLERRSGGRLGVAVLDAKSGKTFAHRGDERFAMCSRRRSLRHHAGSSNAETGRVVAGFAGR